MTKIEARCSACGSGSSTRHHACHSGGLWCPGQVGRGAEPGWQRGSQPQRACGGCGAALGISPMLRAALASANASLLGVLVVFGGLFALGLIWLVQEPAPPAPLVARASSTGHPDLTLSAATSITGPWQQAVNPVGNPSEFLRQSPATSVPSTVASVQGPAATAQLPPAARDDWASGSERFIAQVANEDVIAPMESELGGVVDILRADPSAANQPTEAAFIAVRPGAPATTSAPAAAALPRPTPAPVVVASTSASSQRETSKATRGGRKRDAEEQDGPRIQLNIQFPGGALSVPIVIDGHRD